MCEVSGNFFNVTSTRFRYLGQKKYDELLDMLYDGALLFLNHDQVSYSKCQFCVLTDHNIITARQRC